MNKILESMNDLAEEGWDVIKTVGNTIVNIVAFVIMFPLFVIGWLKRHLTKREPDGGKSGKK